LRGFGDHYTETHRLNIIQESRLAHKVIYHAVY